MKNKTCENSCNKASIDKRLKTIGGHLNKVISMVNEDRYCMDILQQTTAVKNAMKQVEILLLDCHLHGCVAEGLKKGKKNTVDELLFLFKKMNK